MSQEFIHIPVLLSETIESLAIKPDGLYVDCTTGGGGHSFEIVKKLSEGGRLIAIDQDSAALEAAGKKLAPFSDRVTFIHDNFLNLESILGGAQPDGILMDLGVSSYQIDTPERGFSYMKDAPLDMRMNPGASLSAFNVVNDYSEEELARIIFEYGEERFSRKIASSIVRRRAEKPVETTFELASIVSESVPRNPHEPHPEKRTFQAIRIEVNGELDVIEPAIRAGAAALKPGGRLSVITFHSLEDRIVKRVFAELIKGCVCPPEFPVCVCGKVPVLKPVTKKPITAANEELELNTRSHSAKLRSAEKL
ncbi:MAG: 16S rRNA (cytosine(1402)-N(4))-methyltransferase RsmH [Firmicutes bacterium]|nr:16S rRNA (cytosine(1402)-N(4))-methyltransferase RsmH [Bacillota bacterium]